MLLGNGCAKITRANEINWKAERKDNALESVMLFGGGWVKSTRANVSNRKAERKEDGREWVGIKHKYNRPETENFVQVILQCSGISPNFLNMKIYVSLGIDILQ